MNYYNNLSLMMEGHFSTAWKALKNAVHYGNDEAGAGKTNWRAATKEAKEGVKETGRKIAKGAKKTVKDFNPIKHFKTAYKAKQNADHYGNDESGAGDSNRRAAKEHLKKGLAQTGVAAAAVGGTALAAKKLLGKKKSKLEKAKDTVKNSPKKVKEYAKEKWGKYKKLPNGEKIAVAAIPATILAGGAAAIYAWWKKNHKK